MGTAAVAPPKRAPIRGMWYVCIAVLILHLLLWLGFAASSVRAWVKPCEETHPEVLIGLIPSTLLWLLWLLWLWRTQETQKPSSGSVAATFLGWSLFLVLAAIACPGLQRSQFHANYATAVGTLRTIHTAETTYAETYKRGYSASLALLGPPPSGGAATASAADLIPSEVAGGKKSGYIFDYKPGPADASGNIKTFTVSARPIQYGTSGCRNFFADESGVIRQTDEDRAPTAKDPAIAG